MQILPIVYIGYDPFFVHYWTPEQIIVYLEYHDILDIDATGSLIKKFKLPNGELSYIFISGRHKYFQL